MADHFREQVTAAVVTALGALVPATVAVVERDRDTDDRPLQDAELPGLVVKDDGEPAEVVTLGPDRSLERRMAISVEAHVKALTGYSSQLNAILKQVEIAVAGITTAAKWIHYTGADARETVEGGEKPAVRQVFHFEAFYITRRNAPDVAL